MAIASVLLPLKNDKPLVMKALRQRIWHTLILWCAFTGVLFAQAPAQFNYQGAARNSNGQPIANQLISLRLSILDGSENGTAQYSETRQIRTNNFGLYSLQIGSPGTIAQMGNINAVSWGKGPKFIRVEIDPQGGNQFSNAGTTQLLSVPYALYAANSPSGEKGDKGEKGERGAPGEPGQNGTNGSNGKDGIDGINGKSAYELWLQQGNSGNLEDYLNSLKGKDGNGIPGPKGERGERGAPGENGTQGTPGERGEKGEPGLRGKEGPAGPIGPIGPQGPVGPGVSDPKSILSAELDVKGGEGSTMKEVILSIKPAAITNNKLADQSVSPDKVLPPGESNKVLGTDASGKVQWLDKPVLSSTNNWNDVETNKPATDNKQNIYHWGRVGIQTLAPVSLLDVRGAVRFGVTPIGIAVGNNSISAGRANIATAENATAFGQDNKASGANAASFGMRNVASGTMATTFGTDNTASGSRATVFGTLSEVSGSYSTSFGSTNKVPAFGSTVMGANLWSSSDFQTVLGVGNAFTSGNETMFQIGIGDQNRPEIRDNAVTVLKNGFTGIGSSKIAPNSTLQVFGSISTRIRSISNATVNSDDHTLLVKGNVQLPAAEEKNTGRIYHLVLDTMVDATISGNLRVAGIRINMIIMDGKPGARAYTVQSDGTDWVVIGQL